MTVNLPDDLITSIRAEVLSGHFASEEEMIAAAVRDYLRRRRGQDSQSVNSPGEIGAESSAQELQHRLCEAGVLGEVKPPISDLSSYRNRRAAPIQGEPLSETVLRERR